MRYICTPCYGNTKEVKLTWVGQGVVLAQGLSKTETEGKAYLLTLGRAAQRTRTEVRREAAGGTNAKMRGCIAHLGTASWENMGGFSFSHIISRKRCTVWTTCSQKTTWGWGRVNTFSNDFLLSLPPTGKNLLTPRLCHQASLDQSPQASSQSPFVSHILYKTSQPAAAATWHRNYGTSSKSCSDLLVCRIQMAKTQSED